MVASSEFDAADSSLLHYDYPFREVHWNPGFRALMRCLHDGDDDDDGAVGAVAHRLHPADDGVNVLLLNHVVGNERAQCPRDCGFSWRCPCFWLTDSDGDSLYSTTHEYSFFKGMWTLLQTILQAVSFD